MDTFEYLSVLISVLLGLAVTHIFAGLVEVIQKRTDISVYWLHIVWAGNIVLWITFFWWFFFAWDELPSWSMRMFYLFFGYAALLSVAAGVIFPIRDSIGDYKEFFYAVSPWFFSFQFIAQCCDVAEVVMKSQTGLRAIPPEYPIFIGALLIGSSIGIFTKNERFHSFYGIFVPVWFIAYATSAFSALT